MCLEQPCQSPPRGLGPATFGQRLGRPRPHFREHGEPGLADWLDSLLSGDPVDLPQRIVATFRHGMGGLMDPTLSTNGIYDPAATARRDGLAEELYAAARAELP